MEPLTPLAARGTAVAAGWRALRVPTGALKLVSLGLSVLLVGVVARAFAQLDWRATVGLVPLAPGFWLTFAAFYLAGPAADWVIFRRLWRLPAR